MLSENKGSETMRVNYQQQTKATLEIYLYFYTWENIAVSVIDEGNK